MMATDPLRYRQSRLRAFTTCARRTVLDTGFTAGLVGSSADLGSAFHAVAAEILRTLSRPGSGSYGESQIPTQEAIVIMREVLDAGAWILTADDDKWLRSMVLRFADAKWQPARFMAIEQRLSLELVGPDGEVRRLTAQPDLVIADPPNGAVAVEHKSTLGVPRNPKQDPPAGEPIRGEQYMSEGAMFQLYVQGALVMRRWPRVQYVILREQNWRWGGPPREAQITRGDLEHVEPYLARVMMQLDIALREGEGHELAAPRSGAHCTTRCPVARSCPIPAEQRGLGALETTADAEAEAARWQTIRALDKQMRAALKAHHEQTGEPIACADGMVLAWHDKPDGGRVFDIRPRNGNGASS